MSRAQAKLTALRTALKGSAWPTEPVRWPMTTACRRKGKPSGGAKRKEAAHR